MTQRIFESVRDTQLEAKVALLYDADLPYHNFDHARDTLNAAIEIIGHCITERIRVNQEVVYYALLFHDAGFREDHSKKGFDSKESYSAALSVEMLREHGVTPILIEKVEAAIMSTHRDGKFITADQKVVRAADLAEIAADYAIFHRNSERLRREYELLNGESLSWDQWVEKSSPILRFYLSQEIRLTNYYYDANRESAYHRAVQKNLTQLIS